MPTSIAVGCGAYSSLQSEENKLAAMSVLWRALSSQLNGVQEGVFPLNDELLRVYWTGPSGKHHSADVTTECIRIIE